MRRVFFGSQGLRAGWGICLFAVLLVGATILIVVVAALAFTVLRFVFHVPLPRIDMSQLSGEHPQISPGNMATFLVPELLALAAATLFMAKIEGRSLASYGFALRGALRRFAEGAAFGLVFLSATLAILLLAGGAEFGGVTLHGPDILAWGARWAGAYFLVAVSEEVLSRGYVLQALARGMSFRWATLLTSAGFMALHISNGGETTLGLADVFVSGLVFCVSVWRTGTIWWAVGYHFAWDWAQSYLFGVADSGAVAFNALTQFRPIGPAWLSGGSAGPEGSVVAIASEVVAIAAIWFLVKRRDYELPVRW